MLNFCSLFIGNSDIISRKYDTNLRWSVRNIKNKISWFVHWQCKLNNKLILYSDINHNLKHAVIMSKAVWVLKALFNYTLLCKKLWKSQVCLSVFLHFFLSQQHNVHRVGIGSSMWCSGGSFTSEEQAKVFRDRRWLVGCGNSTGKSWRWQHSAISCGDHKRRNWSKQIKFTKSWFCSFFLSFCKCIYHICALICMYSLWETVPLKCL